MATPLNVLVVAETDTTTRAVLDALTEAGYTPQADVTLTPSAFSTALAKRRWDVVVARCTLARFSAVDALTLLKERQAGTPLIVLTSAVDEPGALEAIAAGAFEAVPEAQLSQLGVVVARARKQRQQQQQQALRQKTGPVEASVPFQAMADGLPIGLYRVTPDGRIRYANLALAAMLGYDRAEHLLDRDVQADLHYPRAAFLDQMRAFGEVRNLEVPWQRRDGTPFYVRETARPVRAEDGTIRYYEGTLEDVTDEYEARVREARQNARLRALVAFTGAADAATQTADLYDAAVEAAEATLETRHAVLVLRGTDGVLHVKAASAACPLLDFALLADDARWQTFTPEATLRVVADLQKGTPHLPEPLQALMRRHGLRAGWVVPLLQRQRPFGALLVFYEQPRRATEDEAEMAQTLAWHVAGAVARHHAETRLNANEEHLQFIAEHTRHVLYRLRNDTGAFDYISPAVVHLTGFTPEQLDALGGLHALVEEREILAGADLVDGTRRAAPGEHFVARYRIRVRDRADRWIENRAFPWYDEDDTAVGMVGILQDVTEQQQREADARARAARSQRQQQALVALSTQAVAADAAGFDAWLTALIADTIDTDAVSLWAYDPETDLLTCRDDFDTARALHSVPDDERPVEVFAPDWETLRQRRILAWDDLARDAQAQLCGLAEFYAERGVGALLVAPIREQANRIVGILVLEHRDAPRPWHDDERTFVATAADLVALALERTRRTRAEEARRQTEERYRLVSELATDFAFTLRLDGPAHARIEWATEAFGLVTGFDPDHLADLQGLYSIVHPADLGTLQYALQHLSDDGRAADLELRLLTHDGSERWIRLTSRLLTADDGQVRIYSTGRDVSARKASEQSLVQAREEAEALARRRNAFLTTLTQELRLPILEMLDQLDNADAEALHALRHQHQRLLDILDALHDLARLERGDLTLEPSPVDFLEQTRMALDLLVPLAEAQQIDLAIEPPAVAEALVYADLAALQRVLYIVCGHTLRVARGRLTVELGTYDGQIALSLHSSLPPDTHAALQDDVLTGTPDAITLLIARHLVDLMGGSLSAERAPGEGTALTLAFPLYAAPAMSLLPTTAEPATQADEAAVPFTSDVFTEDLVDGLAEDLDLVDGPTEDVADVHAEDAIETARVSLDTDVDLEPSDAVELADPHPAMDEDAPGRLEPASEAYDVVETLDTTEVVDLDTVEAVAGDLDPAEAVDTVETVDAKPDEVLTIGLLTMGVSLAMDAIAAEEGLERVLPDDVPDTAAADATFGLDVPDEAALELAVPEALTIEMVALDALDPEVAVQEATERIALETTDARAASPTESVADRDLFDEAVLDVLLAARETTGTGPVGLDEATPALEAADVTMAATEAAARAEGVTEEVAPPTSEEATIEPLLHVDALLADVAEGASEVEPLEAASEVVVPNALDADLLAPDLDTPADGEAAPLATGYRRREINLDAFDMDSIEESLARSDTWETLPTQVFISGRDVTSEEADDTETAATTLQVIATVQAALRDEPLAEADPLVQADPLANTPSDLEPFAAESLATEPPTVESMAAIESSSADLSFDETPGDATVAAASLAADPVAEAAVPPALSAPFRFRDIGMRGDGASQGAPAEASGIERTEIDALNQEPAAHKRTIQDRAPEDDEASSPHGDYRPHVLVVEDNEDIRLILTQILGRHYNVQQVGDARKALEALMRRRFDAMLLDLNLGGRRTGSDVLRVARALPSYDSLYAIALADLSEEPDSLREVGFDAVVAVPFTRQAVLEALAQVPIPEDVQGVSTATSESL